MFDSIDGVLQLAQRANTKAKHAFCLVMNGKHELYRAFSDDRVFQQCLLCGYETKCWKIDRRDRRLHIVRPEQPSGQRQERSAVA